MGMPPMQSISGDNDGTGWYVYFNMPAMFGASTAEVW
jgi:hypothetical protein